MTKRTEYILLIAVLTAFAVGLVIGGGIVFGRDIPDVEQRYETALAELDEDPNEPKH